MELKPGSVRLSPLNLSYRNRPQAGRKIASFRSRDGWNCRKVVVAQSRRNVGRERSLIDWSLRGKLGRELINTRWTACQSPFWNRKRPSNAASSTSAQCQFQTFPAFKSRPPPVVPQFEISGAIRSHKAKAPDDAGALNSSVVPNRISTSHKLGLFLRRRTCSGQRRTAQKAKNGNLIERAIMHLPR